MKLSFSKCLFIAWVIVFMVEIYPLIRYVAHSTVRGSFHIMTVEECICDMPINIWCEKCGHASFDCPRFHHDPICGCVK